MPQALKRISLSQLSLGMVTDANPLDVPPGGAVVGTSNMVWVDGFLRARPGLVSVYQLPVQDRVHHLTFWQTPDGIRELCAVTLNVTSGDATFYHLPTGGAWVSVATLSSPQVLVDIPCTSCNFAKNTFLTPGNGALYQFDGTTLVTVNSTQSDPLFYAADMPHISVAGDARLFTADVVHDSSGRIAYRLEWSDSSRINYWGGLVITDDGTTDGGDSSGTSLPKNSDPITGLYSDSSVLMIFRAREIYLGVFTGSPKVYDVRSFIQGPGCIAHATIKPYRDGAIVWLGDDNVYIGTPGQPPQPIGDKIRLRIRQTCDLTKMQQAKAILDFDLHLYTLILPDVADGLNTKLFTCNLRNGGWWEGDISDPSMVITDTLAFRTGPWGTQHLLATDDGRILKSQLGYVKDDFTDFQCSWKSGILSSKALFGMEREVSSVQTLRVIGTGAIQGVTSQMYFSIDWGNNIYKFLNLPFVKVPQTLFDGEEEFTCERTPAVENFQIIGMSTSAQLCPLIAQFEIGAIAEGSNR